MVIWLANEHLTVVAFIFWGLHCVDTRVCILSLDMIECGVTWQRIQLHSHVIHVCMGLTSILSHGFTW